MPICELKMRNVSTYLAALGNFDGVHWGHQRIIARVVEKSHACGGIPTVITFYPLPSRAYILKNRFFN